MAELLPWHGAADVVRLSPVHVSARYLAHIRAAWNARFPGDRLETQDVVLTLPASFDEVSRELTIKAAARANLPSVVLIEEPQAAIYQWIYAHQQNWQELVQPGQKILVCDIGGGTSDFTLIRVAADSQGKAQFHRVAVGEHLILGGDNLDLALAHYAEQKLAGDGRLEPRQWAVLVQSCRRAKESLLADGAAEKLTLSVPGSGSRLIGGALQLELSQQEVQQLLVEGFFPFVGLDDKPLARRSGFQEFGLPYAPDAAITRYLAAFLTAHRHVGLAAESPLTADHDPARPDVVLLGGGVFDAAVLRERLLAVVSSWFPAPAGNWQPQVLENDRRDLAVARGAAYYGMVRRGIGVRIAAGLARSYFIGAAASAGVPSAVCLVPAGTEEGHSVDLAARRFDLLIRQPVEFPLYVSSTQLVARAGDMVPIDREQMTALPPIRTVLQSGKKAGTADSVAVELHSRLTEIGTLELWCSETGGPAHLETAVRRSRRHPHRADRSRGTGRTGGHRRRGHVGCVSRVDRRHVWDGGQPTARQAGALGQATGRGHRKAARGLAPFAVARVVEGAHRIRGRPEAECRARSALAEPAWLCLAPRLRHGGRRLAGGPDASVADRLGAQQRDVPGRVVDPLAARGGRIAGRTAAVIGRATGRRNPGVASGRGQRAWT